MPHINLAMNIFAVGASGASAPVVSSVQNARGNAVGDTAGAYTVTVGGSGFTGATGVTFGGVAATSVVVVNDSSLTCTVPDMTTPGLKDVVVTAPGGTSTGGTNAFRAWDPSDQAFEAYWGDARTTSGSNVTQWTDNTANGRNMPAGGTAPTVGGGLNGHNTIAFGGSATLGNTVTLANLLGTGAHTLLAVVKTATTLNAGNIVSDDGSWAFLSATGATTANRMSSQMWDSNYRTATSTKVIASNTWYLYESRGDTTNLYCRVNDADVNQGSAAFTGLGGSNVVRIGAGFVGELAAMVAIKSNLSAAVRGYWADWAITRFGLTLT